MFVPSESVYAELHDSFDDLIQKAYRVQVVLVSPSLLMLAIQVMQQILKDARMREAAHEIRTEVGHLMSDLGRLARARAQPAKALWAGQQRYCANPDLGREGRQTRRTDQFARIRE
jgi:DNA anti-recombination protein RmuC